MAVSVPLLTKDQINRLPEHAREVVEYRKSGLSLNHIQGCSLGRAYCVRHTYGLWDENQPRALMSDAQAVDELVRHRYFQPHVTPIQVFNRSTEPYEGTARRKVVTAQLFMLLARRRRLDELRDQPTGGGRDDPASAICRELTALLAPSEAVG